MTRGLKVKQSVSACVREREVYFFYVLVRDSLGGQKTSVGNPDLSRRLVGRTRDSLKTQN